MSSVPVGASAGGAENSFVPTVFHLETSSSSTDKKISDLAIPIDGSPKSFIAGYIPFLKIPNFGCFASSLNVHGDFCQKVIYLHNRIGSALLSLGDEYLKLKQTGQAYLDVKKADQAHLDLKHVYEATIVAARTFLKVPKQGDNTNDKSKSFFAASPVVPFDSKKEKRYADADCFRSNTNAIAEEARVLFNIYTYNDEENVSILKQHLFSVCNVSTIFRRLTQPLVPVEVIIKQAEELITATNNQIKQPLHALPESLDEYGPCDLQPGCTEFSVQVLIHKIHDCSYALEDQIRFQQNKDQQEQRLNEQESPDPNLVISHLVNLVATLKVSSDKLTTFLADFLENQEIIFVNSSMYFLLYEAKKWLNNPPKYDREFYFDTFFCGSQSYISGESPPSKEKFDKHESERVALQTRLETTGNETFIKNLKKAKLLSNELQLYFLCIDEIAKIQKVAISLVFGTSQEKKQEDDELLNELQQLQLNPKRQETDSSVRKEVQTTVESAQKEKDILDDSKSRFYSISYLNEHIKCFYGMRPCKYGEVTSAQLEAFFADRKKTLQAISAQSADKEFQHRCREIGEKFDADLVKIKLNIVDIARKLALLMPFYELVNALFEYATLNQKLRSTNLSADSKQISDFSWEFKKLADGFSDPQWKTGESQETWIGEKLEKAHNTLNAFLKNKAAALSVSAASASSSDDKLVDLQLKQKLVKTLDILWKNSASTRALIKAGSKINQGIGDGDRGRFCITA